ncbi:hypothetical protein GCM10007938_39900 [Vibrio zhanjiangensis]|uniref:Uncharacterized protein n=1 Tax=Vibrio zhanjiangensis TaxID=1046128 RepID=A0ABQ6F4L8_9VIBR|nr:hypothetical protein [Vibrio zhanjiangensis]GLT20207.1 hypothetical protein GCM10007938_39900 [Vibrio zhanjiangensis]
MEENKPDRKAERDHHYDFGYPFPPRHCDWYWSDADMTYDQALTAFHAQTEQEQRMKRNPVNRNRPKRPVDPNYHDGKSYPFPPRYSMAWENNEYGISYDEAVALYEHEKAKWANIRLTTPNPLVLVTHKNPQGSRLAVQAMNEELAAKQKAEQAAESSTPVINPNNAYWPPYNFVAEEGKEHINVTYEQPIKDYAWLSVEEAEEFAQNLYEDMGGKDTVGNIKNYGFGLGKATYDAHSIAKGLGGLHVQAYTKSINGQDWIIIKNYRKHLKTLERGHMWQANNPRIIQLGLGLNDLKGATRYVRFNVGLEIAVSVGINAVDYALRDEATMAEFVGNSAGDIVKGMLSLVGGALFTAVVVPTTVGVLVTSVVFALASFAFGHLLNVIDEQNGYSKSFTQEVAEFFE